METPDFLFPTFDEAGSIEAVDRVFASTKIDEEAVGILIAYTNRFADLIEQMGPISMGREGLADSLPWLDSWARQMDDWIEKNGLAMPIPLQKLGQITLMPNIDRPTPDHLDTFRHLPVGLSIGMQGERELVGVALDSIEEGFETQKKLQTDRTPLWTLDEIAGKEVQRITQRRGDVIHIGGFATLHSGRPVDSDEAEFNGAMTVGYESDVAEGYEKLADEHFATYYHQSDRFASRPFNSIVSSVPGY